MRSLDIRKDLRVAIAVGLVLLLGNAACFVLVVRPRMREYQSLEGGKGAFERELASAQKKKEELAAYYDRIVATEKNADRFFNEILGTKQERSIEIQKEIADIATQFKISPESVSYVNGDLVDDGLEKFEIDLPIAGDYNDLRSFIARIENSKDFLIVDRISLSGTKEGGLNLQLNIAVSTYFNAPWLKILKENPGRGAKTARRHA